MSRSDYKYHIRHKNKQHFILIEDENKGRVSVTNNIENVVEEIATMEGINPVEFHIVYRDSDGTWDGYNFSTKQVLVLNQKSWYGACEAMIERQFS